MRFILFYMHMILTMGLLFSCCATRETSKKVEPSSKLIVIRENAKDISALNKWIAVIEEKKTDSLNQKEYKYSCGWGGGRLTFARDQVGLRLLERSYGGEDGSSTTSFYFNKNNELVVYRTLGTSFGCIPPEDGDYKVEELTIYIKDGIPVEALRRLAKDYAGIPKTKAVNVTLDLEERYKNALNQANSYRELTSQKKVQVFFCK